MQGYRVGGGAEHGNSANSTVDSNKRESTTLVCKSFLFTMQGKNVATEVDQG